MNRVLNETVVGRCSRKETSRDILPYLHANNPKRYLKFDRPKQGDQFSMDT